VHVYMEGATHTIVQGLSRPQGGLPVGNPGFILLALANLQQALKVQVLGLW
jgi:hypothetical protein